jgi:hypothetical protein
MDCTTCAEPQCLYKGALIMLLSRLHTILDIPASLLFSCRCQNERR